MILRGPHRPEFLVPESLHEILKGTAQRFPNHSALITSETQISYAHLLHSAEYIATALTALGAEPGKIVGLLLPRGTDLLVAQAGIAASGAAWLPFDSEVPVERAETCLSAANAIGLLTTKFWRDRLSHISKPLWFIEDLLAPEASRSPLKVPSPQDPAYVIYTSGSTGTPKGIAVSQANICHFLRSENSILEIRSDDKVYQGFSVAFDMSFEEIWISYLVGASLWIAPTEVVSDPDAIAKTLAHERITVLHAVPTLVSLIENFPAHLRLINIGGEACSDALSERLSGKGRLIYNTYGPTETTVSASLAELVPGKSVTIGTPLPNYGMVIVSPDHSPVSLGETGEIAIFGPGVTLGYLNLPEFTSSRFIPNPVEHGAGEETLYLTGDLGRVTPDGQIHCLGRVDNQVKLRGFRIELDEIAAGLSQDPLVATAAAVVRDYYGSDEIVAFVVSLTTIPDIAALRKSLIHRLPSYMVPAHIECLTEMPRLSSGKVNLDALRKIQLSESGPHFSNGTTEQFTPESLEYKALWKALSQLFPNRTFRPEEDFFSDLSGHSLLAARLVTLLRKDVNFGNVGVQTIYQNRTLEKIAGALKLLRQQKGVPSLPHPGTPYIRRFLCGSAQLLCLPFIILLQLLQWLAPFFTYHYFTGGTTDSAATATAASISVFLIIIGVSFPLGVVLKRVLAGYIKPGNYPLWGLTYFRWWLGTQLSNICAVHLVSGTPWKAIHLKMLGARVGRNAVLNSVTVAVPELLEIGNNVCIGTFVNIENARVEGGRFYVDWVRIEDGATIDSYTVLENNTSVGTQAHLCGQSALSAGRHIPSGETWAGAPAKAIPPIQEIWPQAPEISRMQTLGNMLFYALGAAFVSILFFVPTFPAFVVIDWIDAHTLDVFESSLEWWQAFPFFFGIAIPASMAFVTLTALLAGAFRLLLPKQKPGRFPIYGSVYNTKWLLSTIFDTSLEILHGLYASVFVGFWLRLMGAKVGRGSEVSTAEGIIPGMLELGEDSFIADGALLGDEEQHHGWMQLQGTCIGNRSFVGNGAYVQDGAVFPDDVLLGVQSCAPPNAVLASHQTWMGSPPMLLPARETVEPPDPKYTFRPSALRRLTRGLIEAIRIVLPLAFIISAGYVIVFKAMADAEDEDWWACFTTLIVSGLLYSFCTYGLVVVLKWICVGRYRPKKAPMWTLFVWLSEAVTVAYESLAVPALLDHLRGTPMLPWALRLLGAKIGRGTWLNTTDLTEFDCVEIGDYAELNAHSGPQTHLFEDRIMRIGTVHIRAGATIGVRSTVLYDASVGESCKLGPLTLVAKGEHLPPQTCWEGTPAGVPPQHA